MQSSLWPSIRLLKSMVASQWLGRPIGFKAEWGGFYNWPSALIGAGAYGLPLAAYVKGLGKKAVHLGGATQVMFGIKGKRFDQRPEYQKLYNEHWTRSLAEETPAAIRLFDGAPGHR